MCNDGGIGWLYLMIRFTECFEFELFYRLFLLFLCSDGDLTKGQGYCKTNFNCFFYYIAPMVISRKDNANSKTKIDYFFFSIAPMVTSRKDNGIAKIALSVIIHFRKQAITVIFALSQSFLKSASSIHMTLPILLLYKQS